jgi:hypothetical protein
MPTTFLNLTDLDNRIRDLEQRYDATSYDVLTDGSVRERIPEDALLKWETYIRQRSYMRDLNDQKHSQYLGGIGHRDGKEKEKTDELVFAA